MYGIIHKVRNTNISPLTVSSIPLALSPTHNNPLQLAKPQEPVERQLRVGPIYHP